MLTFQVVSRAARVPAVPKNRPRRISREWLAVLHIFIGINIAAVIFVPAVIFLHFSDAIFILLPVLMSITISQARRFNRNLPLGGTPRYILFTICLAFAYCGVVVAIELPTHQGSGLSHTVLICTTLTWAIILEPARAYFQSHIEQRFNTYDRTISKVIEDFTSTLREEIDLTQLREHFLAVIEQAIHPYSISLWLLKLRQQETELAEITFENDDPFLLSLLSHPKALEIERLHLDSPALRAVRKSEEEIALPLVSQGALLGLLLLGPRLNGQAYVREDFALLNTLAAQFAPALRVAHVVQEQQEQVRERERIEQELRTAQAIQHAFLPKEVPELPGWQLAPYYKPAREVGGDFYDFLPFENGSLGLVIGDVTGKGVPAALVMATVHTMLRAAAQETSSPGDVLARVNDLLAAEIPQGMFVTCFYALLDPRSGHLCYANAGHEPPYRQQAGKASELLATGMPLGMLPGSRYEEQEATLAPGESLLFFSDGLVEAHNSNREMFGLPRLQSLLAAHADGSPLIDFVRDELQRFTGEDWEQEDDVTLLMVRRTA
jgi:serine phosphatase RsbU (regulator of sigma subunit)